MSDNIKMESIANALRGKIGSVSALRNIFSRDRVHSAQKVIDTTRDNYFDHVQEFLDIFQAAAKGTASPKQVYETTKSLKAQAEGLGFVFLMDLSNALYKFLQEKMGVYSVKSDQAFGKEDRLVVQHYAAAIVAALEKRESGKGGIVEAGILDSLDMLRRKYGSNGS